MSGLITSLYHLPYPVPQPQQQNSYCCDSSASDSSKKSKRSHKRQSQESCSFEFGSLFCDSASKRRFRTNFSESQSALLEEAFQASHYPDQHTKRSMSAALEIPEDRITVWFQNRRAKWRRKEVRDREKSSLKGGASSTTSPSSPPSSALPNPSTVLPSLHTLPLTNSTFTDPQQYMHTFIQQQTLLPDCNNFFDPSSSFAPPSYF